ncbi:hypothetical protein H0X10_03975 [Candidatus Saccharibacteria bacterium]|nr:hypothetical protein [Candidatus Saccharibacteria bacterium]
MASSAKTKKTQKPTAKTPPARRIEAPTYRSFRISKRLKPQKQSLPKARILFRSSLGHLWKYRKSFIGITAVYLVLTIILVKGLSVSNNIPELKQTLQETLTGASGQLTTGLAIFGFLIGNASGVSSDIAGTYQSILLVLVSLALIWALRQTHAGNTVHTREAFYRGMYPLIPFLAVLLVIGVQFLPLVAASWLFNITVISGLAVTTLEQILWSTLSFSLALLSIYLVSSSVFALYVSTLPDMRPMRALRSTRDLVRYRRWEILRKVLFLPLVLLVIGAVIVLPIILFLTPLTEWVFFALSMFALAVSHSYIYSLYRELL